MKNIKLKKSLAVVISTHFLNLIATEDVPLLAVSSVQLAPAYAVLEVTTANVAISAVEITTAKLFLSFIFFMSLLVPHS